MDQLRQPIYIPPNRMDHTCSNMDDHADSDEGDETTVMAVRAPAYNLLECGPSQPQCSGDSTQFCFFCSFESSDDGGVDGQANDHPSSLRSLVHALLHQKREVHAIIVKVYEAYNKNIRAEVTWTNPAGEEVVGPAWSKDSIKRHLVSSPEFPAIFEDAIESIYTNIISSQNSRMMTSNGAPDADMVKQFNDTVRCLCQYKESRARLTRQTTRGANKLR